MLLSLEKWGGTIPRVEDPALIPDGKAQTALDCRFDLGGIAPYFQDNPIVTPTNTGPLLSLFGYYDPSGVRWFFAWNSDVDAIKTPLLGDTYDRVFYTEGGVLKVTDSTLYKQGGTAYPMAYMLPSPPAPTTAPTAAGTASWPGVPSAANIVSSWTNPGSGGYNTFSSPDGPDIASAIHTSGGAESASSASISTTSGHNYRIVAALTVTSGQAPTVSFTNPTTSQALTAGTNTINFTATGSSTVLTISNTSNANWSCTFLLYDLTADPTMLETRGWIYTYVNSYGQEGPPSPVSNLLQLYDGNTCYLTGITAAGLSALYDLAYINIYRLNMSLSSAQYQFVAQIAISATTYSDSLLDAALGEVLAATEWDGPPSGAAGLIALPNGVCACFVGNRLLISAINAPHAYPASYEKATERDIVVLGNIGTTIVVLTQGPAYGVVCNDPSNTVMEKIDGALACSSKRSRVHVEAMGIEAYASPEGIMTIGTDGAKLATMDIMTPKEWSDNYNPSIISAWYWEGKYIGFYTHGAVKAGFMFDFGTHDFVDLDFYATAGFHDLTDGRLYLVISGAVVSFSDTTALRSYNWLSKKFRFPPSRLSCIKVIGAAYPARVDIIARDLPKTVTINATSKAAQRIPKIGMINNCEIRVSGQNQVSAVYIASTMEELPL